MTRVCCWSEGTPDSHKDPAIVIWSTVRGSLMSRKPRSPKGPAITPAVPTGCPSAHRESPVDLTPLETMTDNGVGFHNMRPSATYRGPDLFSGGLAIVDSSRAVSMEFLARSKR